MQRGVLYTADGAVSVPTDQAQLLSDVSPRLSLRWHVGMGCFYVALQWADDDPRHAIDPTARGEERNFSCECFIPADVPLEQMGSWAMRQMGARVGTESARMMQLHAERATRHNEARPAAIAEAVRTEFFDAVRADDKTIQVGKRRTRVR